MTFIELRETEVNCIVTFLSSQFFPLLALDLEDFLSLCFHSLKKILSI